MCVLNIHTHDASCKMGNCVSERALLLYECANYVVVVFFLYSFDFLFYPFRSLSRTLFFLSL